jgi:N-formylglutamate deformylase
VRPAFNVERGPGPVVATAIHAGHDLRPAVASRTAVPDDVRLREEDPHTDRLAAVAPTRVVAHRSRFEVDLNRDRDDAVYVEPGDAWGLALWRDPLPPQEIERSLALYDDFYRRIGAILDDKARRGRFVVLDLHSYNHRRDGDRAPCADASANPEVNVGTGSMDRDRWDPLVDRFIDDLSSRTVRDRHLDVRENVRFKGGHLSRWVHERYPDTGCALALEFKKVFMDEWTGAVDERHLDALVHALRSALPGLVDAVAIDAR